MYRNGPVSSNVMLLEDSLRCSEAWMETCVDITNTLTVPSTNRARVAAALHQLRVEHFTGLHVLVDTGVYSAAFALYRPQFEAYVRAAWYHQCASDDQVDGLIAGHEPPGIGKQIDALESRGAFDPGSLTRLKDMTWRNLCDFTHGGTIQVKARAATPGTVAQNFKVEHVAALLTASATTALLASVGLSAVAENDEVANQLKAAYDGIYKKAA